VPEAVGRSAGDAGSLALPMISWRACPAGRVAVLCLGCASGAVDHALSADRFEVGIRTAFPKSVLVRLFLDINFM